MPQLTCPYCEADVPFEYSVTSGEEIFCSYCQCPVVAQRTDRDTWIGIQTEEWAAIKKRQRKSEEKQREDSY